MRKVKILKSSGVDTVEINDDVKTLGDLKGVVNLQGLRIIDETRKEWTVDSLELPEKDFKLFVSLKDTKGGQIDLEDYKQLRDAISQEVKSSQEAYQHFNGDGKNFTNKKKAVLQELFKQWVEGNETSEETCEEETPTQTTNSNPDVFLQLVQEQRKVLNELMKNQVSMANEISELKELIQGLSIDASVDEEEDGEDPDMATWNEIFG